MAANKYIPVVLKEEVPWLTDMGLGRGVDNTKHDPWKDKSSVQVRPISPTLDNIIGTDDGGIRKYFEREVLSTRTRQMEQNLSMVGPNCLIQMSVDSLCTQSVSKSHTSVGEEITTRTISFQHDLYDSPSAPTAQKTSTCFEMKLSHWLVRRIMKGVTHYKSSDCNCVEKLCRYIHDNPGDRYQLQLAQDCLKFIKLYGITHYVYSIQLGANKFRVLSSSEYKKKVSRTAKAGTTNIVKSSLGTTSSWWHRSSSMNIQEIGNIQDGRVNRGAGGEAVIGFKLLPIHTLVSSCSIHDVFMKGLQLYVKERTTETSKCCKCCLKVLCTIKIKIIMVYFLHYSAEGPFLISCGRETILYWSVEERNQVTATPNKKIASEFFITPTSDDCCPHEFMIEYHERDSSSDQDSHPKDRSSEQYPRPKDSSSEEDPRPKDSSSEEDPRSKDSSSEKDPQPKEASLAPLPHYLNGRASMFGYNKGPLEVKLNVTAGNIRFVLHSRVSDDYAPVDLNSWEHGEAFYINCSRRRFKWEGYVSVKKIKESEEKEKYITAIVPSEYSHNDSDTWLLFRLIPVCQHQDDRCIKGLTKQEEKAK